MISNFVTVQKFVDYLDKKSVERLDKWEVWDLFIDCPDSVVCKLKKKAFTHRSFFYSFNILCRKKGIRVLSVDCGNGLRRDFTKVYLIHNKVECNPIKTQNTQKQDAKY